jgi:AmmeMemoRadiSam system protein B
VFEGKEIKLLPIMVGSLSRAQHEYYGRLLMEFFNDSESLILISSDFCHWGKDFDYFYLRENLNNDENSVSKQIEKLDKEAIEFILNLDGDGFADYLKRTENTICGS